MRTIIVALLAISLALNAFLAYKWWSAATVQTSHSTRDMVVMRTPGGLLEVSTITAEERFDSTTSHTVLGVPVGRTVAQIRVPTVYRYHIPLARDWSIRVTGNTLVVIAPATQPSLPVAIDTGKLEAFSSGLWSPITGANAVSALQKTITATLGKKAATPELLLLQRETARQTVSEFVQKWVVDQPRWKGGRMPTIFVFFQDEPLGQRAAPLLSGAP
jgi:hypothetical protein